MTTYVGNQIDLIKITLYKISLELSYLTSYITMIESVLDHIEKSSNNFNKLNEVIESITMISNTIKIVPIICSETDSIDKSIYNIKPVTIRSSEYIDIVCDIYSEPTRKDLILAKKKILNINNKISLFADDIILFENKCSKNNRTFVDRYGFIVSNIDTILSDIRLVIKSAIDKTKILNKQYQFLLQMNESIEKTNIEFSNVLCSITSLNNLLDQKIELPKNKSYIKLIWNYISSFIWNSNEEISYTIKQIYYDRNNINELIINELIINELEGNANNILTAFIDKSDLKIEFCHQICFDTLEDTIEAIANATDLSIIDEIEKYLHDISNEISLLNN